MNQPNVLELEERVWLRRSRPIEAQRCGNKPASTIDMETEVEKYPDAYQSERAEHFGVSQTGIGAAGSKAFRN